MLSRYLEVTKLGFMEFCYVTKAPPGLRQKLYFVHILGISMQSFLELIAIVHV